MRVQFDGVTVDAGRARLVDSVNLEVPSGVTLGLLGPNGSGKSTLLRTLYGARRPDAGRVLLDDTDLRGLTPRERARRVAVMTQETGTDFALDVLDVALLGRVPHQSGWADHRPEDVRIVHDCLAQVDALHLAARAFPSLSGGERQRVLLARALAQQSDVLALDEPTNHLDVRHQLELLGHVVGHTCTTLVALHDVNLALRHCDLVAVLESGRLVATGPPDEVLTPDLIRDVFGVHAVRMSHPETREPVLALTAGPPTRAGSRTIKEKQ